MVAPDPFPLEGGYEIVGWLRTRALELGSAAIAPLENVAREGSVPLRAAALLALAEIDPDGTEGFVLDRAGSDRSREVREAATRALGRSRGAASLAFLTTTVEERAARIALRERLADAPTEDLIRISLDARALAGPERQALVCLGILAERRAAPEDRVFEIVHALARATVDADLGEEEEAERDRALLALLASAPAARVFDELAPLVGDAAPRRALSVAIVELLESQLGAAWTDDRRGFAAADPPCGVVPDVRWRDVLARWAPPPGDAQYTRLDLDDVKAGLDWTYLPRMNRSLRRIDSGGERGAAFALAGFDAGARDEGEIRRALDGLGGVTITNLHRIVHQCGGGARARYRLLGLPLGSRELSEQLAPYSEGVAEMLGLFNASDVVDPTTLAEVRRRLIPFVPNLPPLTGGIEALVWTRPGWLRAALEGLEVVRILPPERPWCEEASTLSDATPDVHRSIGPYTEAHQALLEDVGARLGLGRPSVFVLWANSD